MDCNERGLLTENLHATDDTDRDRSEFNFIARRSALAARFCYFPFSMVALDNSIGALYVGVIVAAILYGFACLQTWYYYTHYSSDPWYLKLLVAVVLLSESCDQAMIAHAVYSYAVTNFGVWAELENITWSMIAAIFFNALTTFLVQCFLALRVYRLNNKSWVTACPLIFVIAEFFSSLLFVVKVSGLRTWVEISARLKGLSMVVNALSAAGDIVIAGFLCYLLQSSRTGFRRSDGLITKLIVFSINTGLLTSLCALASLISISVWPDAFIYITFYYSIDRLYCNTLLATLNARKRLRGGSYDDDISQSYHGHGARMTNQSMTRTLSRRVPANISIKIDTMQEHVRDESFSPNGDVKDPGAF